jgi:arabinofuranan 3-O-arabinosyltransferase
MTSSRGGWRPIAALAAVCYLPLVVTQPGWVSADTKTYLYLDPGRLLSRAWSMWDPHVGLGTVSHQSIGYLWPMGPWFWACERLGVPDWLAQRLWWATILFAAGTGVVYLLRRFAWPAEAVWAAAFVYALCPYVLSLMGRLSGVLLPFAGLPWLLALTIQSIRHKGWRHPALFALAVTTVGSVNLTALALVGMAPLLWLAHAAWIAREAPPRQVLGAATRVAVLTLPVSLWWLAGLSVQASHGIDVVRYTETAEVVSTASLAQEVLRGLGYWFFYGGDRLDLWIEQSRAYTQELWLLAVTFAIPLLALAGAAVGRWRHRAFFVALVISGTFLAVGAHPWDDPPLLGRAVKAFLGSERGLAFRSLPRAAPLVALGLAVLIGSGLAALAVRRPTIARRAALGCAALAVLGLAPLWQREMVAENLRRQEVPAYWAEAADAIDAGGTGTRVLEVPGSDFAAYRWGMTVDPITPGLVDRPYVARELIPYGSPPSADLLNAFDLRLQERTLDPAALAPVARLLRAGDIVLRADLQYERYNTARPRLVWSALQAAPGLGAPQTFGPTTPNEPVPQRQLQDQAWFVEETGLPDPPAVALFPVEDERSIASLQAASGALLLAGDGSGIVDAAGAGLIDGSELIRYSATLSPAEVQAELDRGARLLVTDTNRQRGERWTTVRHTRGYTETADHAALREDLTDNRLAVFGDAPASTRTVAEHRGGISADATSYGNPIALMGEDRPAAAVDGDPTTAWRTGHFSDARGERLRLELDEPTTTDRIRLLQPLTASNRTLTRLRLRLDAGPAIVVDLDDSSRTAPGQLVTFPAQELSTVDIELVADSAGDRPRFAGVGPVGLAEVRIGDTDDLELDEVIRVPTDLLDGAGAASAERPLAFLLTRIRQDPTDATRDDEERSIVRRIELATPRMMTLSGAVRLSPRADPAVLDALLGQRDPAVTIHASSTLTGTIADRPAAALDGDPGTAWASDLDAATGAALTIDLARPTTLERLDLQVVADGRHSVPTGLEVLVDGRSVARPELPAIPDRDTPGATIAVPVELPATTGRHIEVRVTEVRARTSTSWDTGAPVEHPVAIAELGLAGVTLPGAPPRIDTGCATDLLTIDGQAIPVRITGSSTDALAGRPLAITTCGPLTLAAGPHDLRAAEGRSTGVDLDQLVLRTSDGLAWDDAPAAGRAASATILEEGADHLRVRVDAAGGTGPQWLVLGQSHNDGWAATLDGRDLGPPVLVDGFANGWELPAGTDGAVVDLRFTPQRRVDVALVISAISALVCLALALRRPPREPNRTRERVLPPDPDGSAFAAVPRPWPAADTLSYAGARPSRRQAVLAGGAVAVAGALVLTPIVALGVGILAGIAGRHAAARRVVVLLPLVLLAGAAAYVIAWQVRYRIAPGLEWPSELERAHPVAVLAVVLLGVDVAVERLWSRGGS